MDTQYQDSFLPQSEAPEFWDWAIALTDYKIVEPRDVSESATPAQIYTAKDVAAALADDGDAALSPNLHLTGREASSQDFPISPSTTPPGSDWHSRKGSNGERDTERRKEQNRTAQRAYRDRQKNLVNGLVRRVQGLVMQCKKHKADCEHLEARCRRLEVENEVFRSFLHKGQL